MKKFWEENVTKKDLLFIMIIILEFTFGILIKNQLSSSEVVNVISISAGTASIFLAAVAILYSYNQGSDSARQNESLNNSLVQMNSKIHELSILKDELIYIKDGISSVKEDSKASTSEIIKEFTYLKQNLMTVFKEVTMDESPQIAKIKLDAEEIIDKSIESIERKLERVSYTFTLKLKETLNTDEFMTYVLGRIQAEFKYGVIHSTEDSFNPEMSVPEYVIWVKIYLRNVYINVKNTNQLFSKLSAFENKYFDILTVY